jgi:hypothetical protein
MVGRVFANRLAGAFFESGTPVHVLDPEPVGELSRGMDSLALQPQRDPFPGVFVSVRRLLRLAMSREEFWHPGVPRSTVYDGHSPILLRLQLGAEDLCLDGVVRIVGPKAGGFVVLFLLESRYWMYQYGERSLR